MLYLKSFKKAVSFLAVLVLSVSLTGCVYMIVGGVGAMGGYIVSPDTVEGMAEYDSAAIFNAAKEVLSVMGKIEEENPEGGLLTAKVAGSKVTVMVTSVNEHMSKLQVKSRRSFFPRIAMAQEVYVKIMNELMK